MPAGFVLTTAAYDAFVDANGIAQAVVGPATLPPTAQPDAYADTAGRIRALFAAGEVPSGLLGELHTAYKALDGEPVAVRSSATAEDLAGAGFAGQQETYLNVRGPEALLAAVRDCWASLWTARALAYRARQCLVADRLSLAVVVQQMVESDAAGVMFTANPTTGRPDELRIGAAWGSG